MKEKIENGKEKMRARRAIAGFEMFLLIAMSFAVAFILQESLVSGQKVSPRGEEGLFAQETSSLSVPNDAAGAVGPNGGEYSILDGTLVRESGEKAIFGGLKEGDKLIVNSEEFIVGKDGSASLASSSTAETIGSQAPKVGFKEFVFGGKGFGAGVPGALFSGLVWGGIVYGAVYLIGSLLGLSNKQTQSLAMGLGAGTFVGSTLYFTGKNLLAQGYFSATGKAPFLLSGWGGFLIGAGVATAIILATYTREKKEIVRFECLPWEAPLGGENCEKCNENKLMPCSEYRCKSLGQACELENKGTDEEICIWKNREDTQAPKIFPWNEALKPAEQRLSYIPDNTISPPNTGFKIIRGGASQGCLQAWTALEFGITTDEPAQCRIDYDLTEKYSEMNYLFGDSTLFRGEHVQRLKVPSPFSENNTGNVPEIHNDGTYTLYVRCLDANGNGENSAAVAFRFCVAKGPDTTQPQIIGTSIISGSPVSFSAETIPIEVYVNEPAECKWSRQDKAYDLMENQLSCVTESYQVNADLNYVCSGSLTGIENRKDNNFFFRCIDKPGKPANERNLMTTSFPLLLRGTEELVITKVGPNATFEGGTGVVNVNLTVTTAHGENEGAATCYLSDTNEPSSFTIAMQGAGSNEHYQPLDLVEGNYIYYFKCVDRGGNSASSNTTFNVKIDRTPPLVTRVFKDGDNLKLITNEQSKCAYSLTSCNYNLEQADTLFAYEDPVKRTVHVTAWNPDDNYYIKCADLKGNQPSPPNTCQIIVQGSELFD